MDSSRTAQAVVLAWPVHPAPVVVLAWPVHPAPVVRAHSDEGPEHLEDQVEGMAR
jgi:hypothetical protein